MSQETYIPPYFWSNETINPKNTQDLYIRHNSLNPIMEYKEWIDRVYGRPLKDDIERREAITKYWKLRRPNKFNVLNL